MRNKQNILKVIENIEFSLRENPENDKLLLNLAEAYYELGIFDGERLDLYELVSEKFPDISYLHQALSICYLLQQVQQLISDVTDLNNLDLLTLEKNISKLQSLSEKYPDNPVIANSLADILLIHGDIEESINAFEDAIHRGLTDLQEILTVFELAYYHFTFTPEQLIYFAEIYQKVGNKDKAIDLYRTAINNGYLDSKIAGKLITLLHEKIKTSKPYDDTNIYYAELAQIYLSLGETTEALIVAQKINLRTLYDFTFIKKLARILINMEDYRQAFDYLSKIPLDEETKKLINEITIHLEKRGELDTAVYLLKFINDNDIAIAEAKENEEKEIEINTELGLGELNYRNKKYDLALEKYINVISLGFNDYDSIMPKIERILKKIDKPPILPLLHLGNLFQIKGEFYRAIYYYELLMNSYPDNNEARKQLRLIYDALLAKNPDLAEMRIKSGDLYFKDNNTEKAIEEYSYAINFPEVNLKANKRLARLFLSTGNYQMAFEKYKYNPLLEDDDFDILYELMKKFEESKCISEAAEVAKIIYDSNPNYKDIKDEYTRLQKIQKEAAPLVFIDPKMVELIGEQAIGRYRYIEKIGSGGMGVVYKAFDIKNDCIVAIKVLREGFSSSSKAIDRFFREARIAATLNHRNIVNIFDYTISNVVGQSYISMEFVDGPSLREIIEKRFKDGLKTNLEDVKETLFYISQLCDALDATHKKGIIHRDIKPDNIMVNSKNLVKITDFGIVHIEEATFTPTGALIGTPRYMSPEQIQGGKIDGRSDLYSVGVILYEMLVGTPPFISGDIAYQQVNVVPTKAIEICNIIPDIVDNLIMKILEKNPNNRFTSAVELKNNVDTILKKLGGYSAEKTTQAEGHQKLDSELDI